MIAITKSKGNAKEYCLYSCNLCYGCGFGCNYNTNGGCYAAAMAVRFDWFESIKDFQNNPRPREGIIEALKKDAPALVKRLTKQHAKQTNDYLNGIIKEPPEKHEIPFVLLSFMTDPYQPINQKYQLTRQAIEILHENGLGVNILTKGEITDWDLLAKNPHLSKVGVTLTGGERDYEMYAEHPMDRLFTLSDAKSHNIKTWVSMEPVINPERCFKYIRMAHKKNLVDEFKIGKWNYSKEADKIDWPKFTNDAIKLLKDLGCRYYIKKSLRKYIKEGYKWRS